MKSKGWKDTNTCIARRLVYNLFIVFVVLTSALWWHYQSAVRVSKTAQHCLIASTWGRSKALWSRDKQGDNILHWDQHKHKTEWISDFTLVSGFPGNTPHKYSKFCCLYWDHWHWFFLELVTFTSKGDKVQPRASLGHWIKMQ